MYEPKLGLKGGRLGKQRDYFRFTAPVFPYRNRVKLETANVSENSLVVTWGGGVNVILSSKPLYSAFPVMLLTLDNDFEDSQKKGYLNGIAAWLKSSFVLWYITAIYQTDDLFEVLINDKKIPLPKDLKVLVELGSLAEKVSASEVNVLRAVAKERPSEREREKAIATLLKHNKAVQDNMKQIDRTVLRNVSASKQEITEIYRVLRDLDLYDYGISTDLDSFIKEVEEGK